MTGPANFSEGCCPRARPSAQRGRVVSERTGRSRVAGEGGPASLRGSRSRDDLGERGSNQQPGASQRSSGSSVLLLPLSRYATQLSFHSRVSGSKPWGTLYRCSPVLAYKRCRVDSNSVLPGSTPSPACLRLSEMRKIQIDASMILTKTLASLRNDLPVASTCWTSTVGEARGLDAVGNGERMPNETSFDDAPGDLDRSRGVRAKTLPGSSWCRLQRQRHAASSSSTESTSTVISGLHRTTPEGGVSMCFQRVKMRRGRHHAQVNRTHRSWTIEEMTSCGTWPGLSLARNEEMRRGLRLQEGTARDHVVAVLVGFSRILPI